jgi:hypothetical protein
MNTIIEFWGTSKYLGLAAVLCVIAASAAACARKISSSEPSVNEKIVGSEPAPPRNSSFLKDYQG